jgi:N-methylhydantoinase A
MPRICIPPAAGLFSAFGLLHANLEHQIVQTYLRTAEPGLADELDEVFGQLERQAVEMLLRQGSDRAGISVERQADVRYADQGYELTVPVPPSAATGLPDIAELVDAFGAEHFRTYGHRADDEPVAVVNLRVSSRLSECGPRLFELKDPPVGARAPRAHDRDAYFGREHGVLATPVITRAELDSSRVDGPLIVEEYDATCVIPPSATAYLDEWANIVVEP